MSWALLFVGVFGEPLEGPLVVTVDIFWPDRRNHDIENLKGLFDALSGVVWVDDGQIVDLHLTKAVDKENPRLEMTVEPA